MVFPVLREMAVLQQRLNYTILHLWLWIAAANLFIDDENNVRIREVNTSGIITTIAGIGTDGFSGDGGAATAAQLNEPYGVCVDAFQNVFIGDRANSRIRVINSSGNIYTYGGNGTRGFTGDNGPAVSGEIYLPYGVAVDGKR